MNIILDLDKTKMLIKTPVDVLRVSAWLSGFNPVELGKRKFISFRRKHRKTLLDLLNKVVMSGNMEIMGYENVFKRLNERLHSSEFAYEYPLANKFLRDISNGILANKKFHIDNIELPIEVRLGAATPGQILRRAISLGRNYGVEIYEERLFIDAIYNATTTQLLQLLGLVNSDFTKKIAIIPGENTRSFVYDAKVSHEWDTDYSNSLGYMIEEILMKRFARLGKLGNIYVNPELYLMALPFGERSNRGNITLTRGTICLFDDDDLINFGIHWNNTREGDRVDLDLSALLFDKDFNYIDEVSWRNLRIKGTVTHSGDITNAINGASEFLQIGNFTGYIVPMVTSFTGQIFDDFDAEFVLFFGNKTMGNYKANTLDIARKNGISGYYNPATVKIRNKLFGKYKSAMPVVVNCVDGRVIVSNLYNKGYRVPALNNDLLRVNLLSMIERYFVTWSELIELHVRARGGNYVEKEDAEKIVENVNDAMEFLV